MESNLRKRIITAIIIGPLSVFFILNGGLMLNLLIMLILMLMFNEATSLLKETGNLTSINWFLGFLYSLLPTFPMIMLAKNQNGNLLILAILIIIWATDSFAYFGGRYFGGKKLFPKVSPKKTWSGAFCGLAAGLLFGVLFLYLIKIPIGLFAKLAICFIISVSGQLGDLFESYLKRLLKVKNSGNILPGHGGILDRMDSSSFAMPVGCYIYFNFLVG